MTTEQPTDLLSVAGAADAKGCAESTVRIAIRGDVLPATPVIGPKGRRCAWAIKRADLERWYVAPRGRPTA